MDITNITIHAVNHCGRFNLKTSVMKKLFLPLIASCFFFLSCKKFDTISNTAASEKNVFDLKNDHLKIAVVSDIHYTDPALFTNNGMAGQAFQDYLAQDPKLLAYSDPI